MSSPNPSLDETVRACFDVVMQNMTTEEIVREAVKYGKLEKSLQDVKKPNSCEKAYSLLSILINNKELDRIKTAEKMGYLKAIQADSEG